MTNLMEVNHNWASRPADQRYLSVSELYQAVKERRENSRERGVAVEHLAVHATEGNNLRLLAPGGEDLGEMTHFAFGQLCARAGAPAKYLRSLPAELAQIPLQWSLERGVEAADRDGKVLTRKNGSDYVASVTSGTYGRIYDEEVVRAVLKRFDLSKWGVPAATYSATDPKRATTLYASDRDVFLFLVSENEIEVTGESLKRGVIVWNSEVGAATLGIKTFTYDRVCDNRIIWNAGNLREVKIRHTSGAPDRFLAEAVPALSAYVNADTRLAVEAITRAKGQEVGDTRGEVLAWLHKKGFTQGLSRQAYDLAEKDPRGYNPRSVWGLVQGLTDAAHDVTYQDARTDIEMKAGKLLEEVAA